MRNQKKQAACAHHRTGGNERAGVSGKSRFSGQKRTGFWSRLQSAALLLAVILCMTGCGMADVQPSAKGEDASGTEDAQAAMEVHFIDVGQGDATLIMCGTDAMLIDAGDNSSGTKVQNYLQKQGVTELHYVIGTHPDADHIGGLDVVITKFDCDTILMPERTANTATYRDVVDAVKYKNNQITTPKVGDTYSLGDASFTILSPKKNYEDSNDCSIALMVTHGEEKFLFTGDAEEEAETDMVNGSLPLAADVYQVGHHGSRTSTSQAFLDAVDPAYAVISCGEDNSYGHPAAETLIKLREAGVQVFRTDEQGSIVAVSDGESITWNCSPSTSWQPGEPTGNSDSKKTKNKSTKSEDKTNTNPAADSQTTDEVNEDVGQAASGLTDRQTLTYICNTSTKKFHLPGCSAVNRIKESNKKEVTGTREELIGQGYDPCGICNP